MNAERWMGKAGRRAEPWPTICHGSDYAGRRRGDTSAAKAASDKSARF